MNTQTLTKPVLVNGDEVVTRIGLWRLSEQYNALLALLYPDRETPLMSAVRLHDNLVKSHHHYCFVLVNNEIVSTARAVLDDGGPDLNAVVGDVITRDGEGYRRKGYGTMALNAVVEQSFNKWSNDESINFVLTNNPNKGNGGFYAANGWLRHDTQVWVKPIHPSV